MLLKILNQQALLNLGNMQNKSTYGKYLIELATEEKG